MADTTPNNTPSTAEHRATESRSLPTSLYGTVSTIAVVIAATLVSLFHAEREVAIAAWVVAAVISTTATISTAVVDRRRIETGTQSSNEERQDASSHNSI